jgi:FG-GAP repeat
VSAGRVFILAATVGATLGCGGDEALGPPADPVSRVVARVGGTGSSDWTGLSVGSLGDVNGDGAPDFVTSALAANSGGRVGVIYGPLRGDLALADADLVLEGEAPFHNAGESLVEAGGCDVDGDGLSDILVGAPYADRTAISTSPAASGDNTGRAYIVFGRRARDGVVRLDAADVTLLGVSAYDAAGSAVACLGDLDGDGRGDIAVSSARGGPLRSGAVYIVYGRARTSFPSRILLESADATLRGRSAYDGFGASVAAVGDVDGDGYADLAVGAPGVDAGGAEGGALYVVRGGHHRLSGERTLASPAALGAPGQRMGRTVTRAGDFDGDGRADVLAGGAPVMSARAMPGAAWVLLGPASGAVVTLAGDRPGDAAGAGVTSLGDLDGDQRAELCIGAPRGVGEVPGAGRVWLVRGRAVRGGARIDLGGEFVVARGAAAGDSLGEVLRGAVDVDGDGVRDLLVSARRAGQDHAGAAMVISGKGLSGR